MKNIHVLPTDKPSNYVTNYMEKEMQWHNIYITSDEEIKDVRPHRGKWQLEKGQILNKFPTYLADLSECKLVIMTTDQDLIKDGVQAIDDEFLEWFVNNPSCEKVEVVDNLKYFNVDELRERHLKGLSHLYSEKIGYKIIIPKEEPNYNMKQEILAEMERLEEEPKQETPTYSDALKKEERLFNSTMIFKQETLEEAAENYVRNESDDALKLVSKYSFKDGAKWQAERMYSLDEILKSFDNLGFKQISSEELNSLPYQPFITDEDGNIWVIDKEKWFEQFKKKV